MSSNQNGNNNNKTIGFLIPNLGHYYTRELWREIYMYADEMGCNLLIFSGHPLSPDSADYDQSNLIYTLPNSAMLDGVIFATPSIMSRVSIEEFKEFKSKFNDIPNISIGAKHDDTYNITISNEISSKKIINHLICSHGFSDIAYISGPLKNEEAVARKKGYIDALNENGLTFDDSKVIESGFHSIFGERAANKLMDSLSMLPQAIACGDDEIAMGVCEALKKRGIDVPGDIAIVGFDNSYKGANSTPGLTTVNQAFSQIAKASIDTILGLIEGKSFSKTQELIAETVIRESCSCSNKNITMRTLDSNLDFSKLIKIDGDPKENLIQNRDFIGKSFLQSLELDNEFADEFIPFIGEGFDILVEEFTSMKNPDRLASKIIFIAARYKKKWNQVLNTDLILFMLERIFYYLFSGNQYYDFALRFTTYLRLTINDSINNTTKKELFHIDTIINLNSVFVNKLSHVVSRKGLESSIKSYMKDCNFNQGYLCLFDAPEVISLDDTIMYPTSCNLVYGVKNGAIYENITYKTVDILPQSILNNGEINDLVFYPLYQGEYHFGYFAGDSKTICDYVIMNLQQQLSSVLERLRLIEELEQNAKEIEKLSIIDVLTGLYNRRGFYDVGSMQYSRRVDKDRKLIFVFGDVDGLKQINDTYGHEAGDIVIKTVASCLQNALRSTDVISRLGGDEFAMVLNRVHNNDNVEDIIDRIQNELCTFNKNSELPYEVSISLGYSEYDKKNHKTFDELLGEADKKLYERKRLKNQLKGL